MDVILDQAKVVVRWAAVPLWAGLLTLPFTGLSLAVQITAVTAIGVAAWRFLHAGRAAAFLSSLSGPLFSLEKFFPPLFSWTKKPVFLAVLLLLLLVVPLFQNDYERDVLTLTGLYIVLALGLNIVVGQTGLLNLGYVAFYAVGAYAYAILSTRAGLSFWPGLVLGALAAGAYAVLIGLPTLRLRGDYFAIVTLGLGEITRIVLNNWDGLTGGPNGIANVGRPVLFGYRLHTPLDFYYLVLGMAIVTVFGMRRLIASRIGRAWMAIREDETAAEAMGVNIFRLKLLAFVIGSAVAGAAGVFFASKMAFVSPESFTFFESVMILCMVVLGGMGSIPGIVLGAFLLITLPELFREFQDFRMLAFGAALVVMMIVRPQGILGTARSAK